MAWISLGGVLLQVLIGAFFFGRMDQKVTNLIDNHAKTDRRVDSIELRINDHTERIARLEGRDE